jgi:L,D-peptidoglycan transpeptidase YkuD (ErfK/YbiS/YcfS/YnhG family)
MAWGIGEHTAAKPADAREKREGDKCSPGGLFRLPFAFGLAQEEPNVKLPYIYLSESIAGVDDVNSKFYNQVVDSKTVAKDWRSEEAMRRCGPLYAWGAFIAHNPQAVPYLGSCLFLHVWPGPGRGTAGCTAMSASDMQQVIYWLDPIKNPRLMQWAQGW